MTLHSAETLENINTCSGGNKKNVVFAPIKRTHGDNKARKGAARDIGDKSGCILFALCIGAPFGRRYERLSANYGSS